MNSYSSLRVQGEHVYANNQLSLTPKQTILRLLEIVTKSATLASDFSQVWLLREFQLGDDLASYTPDRQTEDSNNVLYLVCKGRVRLLGVDATCGREVPTQLLLAEQTFGVDHLFCDRPLPYRAVAASAGFLAYIRWHDLNQWLRRLPALEDYLRQLACQQQALIFFKTNTELRSHTSHSLRKLLPYLVQTKIRAGSTLASATPFSQGRFWLVHGEIISSTAKTQPPSVGESWGYPDTTIPDWIAKTDLQLYHIPKEYWQSDDAIAPEFFWGRCKQEDTKTWVDAENLFIQSPRVDETTSSEKSQSESPKPVEKTAEMDFPELRNQRWSASKLWRRYPFIQQQSSSDCGAACLAMISLYWGKRFSLNTLRNLARTDRLGASVSALADAAETLGFDAVPVRASLSKLELQTNPWIAHWQGIHYVVVWRIKGDRVLICDPAIGKRSLSCQEFVANWTGYALLLYPTERLDNKKNEKISFSGFWQAFWHHRHLLGQIILASVLLAVFGLAAPLITQVVLDRVLLNKSLSTLNIFAFGFLFFGIWRISIQAVRQYLLDYFSNRMDITLLGGLIAHTLRLPLQFFASRQAGDIITRLQENRKIQLFFTKQAVSTSLDALMVVIYLGLMAYFNLRLTLMVLVLILPIVVLTAAASPFLKSVSRELLHKSAAQSSAIVETIAGITTVKTIAAERMMRWRWEERFTTMVQTRFRGQKLANLLQLATSLINHLSMTALLWYGAILVTGREMTVGQLVAFNMLIGSASDPVLALVALWDEFQEVLISLERLNDVLATQPEEYSQKPLLVLPPIRGDVRFEHVYFRYNADAEGYTLQNISFQVKAGQTVGIVGLSSSGKSTLVNLLAGLYRPTSGRILIDEHDIAGVSPQSLRSQLGMIPQDVFLFAGSILENITLFDAEICLEQAIAAAKLADAHTFIQTLPWGYDTRIGEGGIILSAGQRQKIAIARALVRNPRILILDEATSCLDIESEHRFQQNLARFRHLIPFHVNHDTYKSCRSTPCT
ncbi:MAG: cysteine peptidase family C39 domain-containing protein, partial [Fischerella sp.]|nr:cysteine peptidase family C39 domain-containing protein [Fischerella sp.]